MYYIPAEGAYATYLDYIASLPIFPLPEAFGLHENADITKDLQQTSLMLDTLALTGGAAAGGGGGGEREEREGRGSCQVTARHGAAQALVAAFGL